MESRGGAGGRGGSGRESWAGTMSTTALRRTNLANILSRLRDEAPLSRSELSLKTSLTPGTVTRLTLALIEAGLVEEQSSNLGGSRGRPRVPMAVGSKHGVIGVHIGMLESRLGIVDLRGRVHRARILAHRGKRPATLITHIAKAALALAESADVHVLGLGVATGGWVDPIGGIVHENAGLGWHDVPLAEQLHEQTGLHTLADSSEFAGVLAERLFGAGRGIDDLVYLFVGNIVGMAATSRSQPIRGAHGAAGFVDHVSVGSTTAHTCSCGRRDCLLAAAGDQAMAAEARSKGWLAEHGSVTDLLELSRSHRGARDLFVRRARLVGGAVARLIEIYDPERVVVSGGTIDDPAYLDDIRAGVDANLTRRAGIDLRTEIHTSSFGDDEFVVASAAVWLDAFYRDPTAYLAI